MGARGYGIGVVVGIGGVGRSIYGKLKQKVYCSG